tara:strand:+ start:3080 stop:3223 length:144 start_codon:yes stop_codon:yes gene_type:complete
VRNLLLRVVNLSKSKIARMARRRGKTERKAERRRLAYIEKKNSGSRW